MLTDETEVFRSRRSSTDDVLEVAEYLANMLECSEMVPMVDSPLARIQTWRAQAPEERDELAIRKLAYELGLRLKEYCQIL